ncbi:MAG: hypothetical protein ACK501_04820 [Planctomycetota bacterium]
MSDSLPTSSPNADPVAAVLRPLLARQLRALRGRYLRHGTALVLAAVAAAVLLFFGLDRWLLLPLPIRLLHTAVVVAMFGYGFVRFVRYPLQKRLDDLDVAVWFERSFPDLHQRVVSAVQLHGADGEALRNQSRPMIEQMVADTAAAVQALPLERMFDPRPERRVFAGAATGLALLLGGALLAPATAKAFLLRHLGLAAEYPRATSLFLELPPAGADLQVTQRGDEVELVLPAGADLHVGVRVEGTVPKDGVELRVAPLRDGQRGDVRSVTMSPRPGDRFRHSFRRLAGSFTFHARGGDDPDGDLQVTVRTVHPPQVANLRASITPPAYTGAPKLETSGGAIEALIGSDVELVVAATAAVKSATLVFLESGKRLPLVADAPQDDSGVRLQHRVRFPVEASDRYQIELLGENGLRNPNPGTYPLSALQDYAPVGRWLLPEDEGLSLLPTALLCLRVEGRDDFGLAAVDLVVEHDGARSAPRSLLLPVSQQPNLPTPADREPATAAPSTAIVRTELLEMRDLLAGAAATENGLVLQVSLRDNKQPQAGASELPRRIVQVVDPEQLAAVVGRLFRGLREEASTALDVQLDRRARLEELDGEGASLGTAALQSLTGIEVGQGRVLSAGERLHRGLMRAFDLHLWNRLEPSQHAAAVVELYRAHSAQLVEPLALDPTFYRGLVQKRAAGELGAMERSLDPILAMIDAADRLVGEDGPAVARALAELQVAQPGAEWQAARQRAIAGQQRCEGRLKLLLERLEEWNDYQDLVQEVRGLRDRQRDVQNRTQEARGKK